MTLNIWIQDLYMLCLAVLCWSCASHVLSGECVGANEGGLILLGGWEIPSSKTLSVNLAVVVNGSELD